MRQSGPPWVQGNLQFLRKTIREVEAIARAAYARDEEACGYLRGPRRHPLLVDEAVELDNLANQYHRVDPVGHPRTAQSYFKINALKFDRSYSEAESSDRPIKVLFHSHLDCAAELSEEDAVSLTGGGTEEPNYELSYLITAVRNGIVSEHRLFVWRWRSRTFEASRIAIVGP